MKTLRSLLAFGVVVAFALAIFPLWNVKASDSKKFTVVEHADTDAVTDTGEKGDTVGDILTFANKVFDQDNKKEMGTDNGHCFRTAVGAAWECAWTLTLSDGQIMVQGPFYDTKDSVMAVTGGTGEYMGMSGQMTLHSRNEKGTEYDFTYELSK